MTLTSPKDTTKAKFIKYFSDKTVVFNNQIIIGLLLLCPLTVTNRTSNLGKDFSLQPLEFYSCIPR